MLPARVRDAFAIQEGHCRRMGAPFTAHLCARLPALLAPDGATARLLTGWDGDPEAGAVALRLCGALHALVRSGEAPELAALYPPVGETGPALDAALGRALAAHDAGIAARVAGSPPQTNEIGRAACLIGALMVAARETGRAIELLEIGSSAGLNLLLDRHGYDLGGGRRAGPEDAAVRIACDWQGRAPEIVPVEIAARAGCDLAPVDAADPAARERLMSFTWPDQPARMARTAAALALAAADPPPVARAEAAEWLEARLAEPAPPGAARVLMHSITWQYLPEPARARIRAAMAAAGARATKAAPLGWAAFERDATPGSAALTLTLWPGGETRTLARCDFHGAWARWEG